MNEIATLQSLTQEQIISADTETLRQHLSQALSLTAKSLIYLSAIWRELERRGEDLSELRSGIAQYLPAIAYGRLDAELVVKYAGKRMLLRHLSNLPIEDQAEIKEKGALQRVIISSDGGIAKEIVPLQDLTSTDLRYIFSEGRIRTESEQASLRQKELRLKSVAPASRMHRKVVLDKERKAIVIGNAAAPIAKIIEALSEYLEFDLQGYLDQRDDTQKALDSFSGKVK